MILLILLVFLDVLERKWWKDMDLWEYESAGGERKGGRKGDVKVKTRSSIIDFCTTHDYTYIYYIDALFDLKK